MAAANPAQDVTNPPRLVQRFAVYAALALVVAAVGALLLARFEAESTARNALADDAAFVADELGRDDLALSAFDGRATVDEQAQLDDFLGTVAAAREIARTSLVGADGTIAYSTDHSLIGRRATDLGDGMHVSRVPVRWRLDIRRVRGSLVAERDAATVAADIRHAFLRDALLVALALLLVYVPLISVFKRVTSALAQREERYRTLMEQASDAILVADPTGRLVEVNARACEILGYSRSELLEKHAMDLMSIRDVSQLPLHMEQLQAGRTILVERPVRRSDGTFIIGDVSAKLLEDGRLLTNIRDVTQRKQLEEELRAVYENGSVAELPASRSAQAG